MKIKSYTFGNVDYNYSPVSQKWQFLVKGWNYTLLAKCPERSVTARKVAGVLNGALKRGSLDGLARASIHKLCYR